MISLHTCIPAFRNAPCVQRSHSTAQPVSISKEIHSKARVQLSQSNENEALMIPLPFGPGPTASVHLTLYYVFFLPPFQPSFTFVFTRDCRTCGLDWLNKVAWLPLDIPTASPLLLFPWAVCQCLAPARSDGTAEPVAVRRSFPAPYHLAQS